MFDVLNVIFIVQNCVFVEMAQLMIVENPLVKQFCGGILGEINWINPMDVFPTVEYDEVHHWHNKKPITDDYDHIKSTVAAPPNNKKELRW